jgi:hypothetical protein
LVHATPIMNALGIAATSDLQRPPSDARRRRHARSKCSPPTPPWREANVIAVIWPSPCGELGELKVIMVNEC